VKEKASNDGMTPATSEVEPIRNEGDREKIQQALLREYPGIRIEFY